jgi:hypothetical protein
MLAVQVDHGDGGRQSGLLGWRASEWTSGTVGVGVDQGRPGERGGIDSRDLDRCVVGNLGSVRPCLLLVYLEGSEGIISYPEKSPIGCLLDRV